MLEKVEEMENDPKAPKSTIQPPTEEDELAGDEADVELEEYADIILEDDSFEEDLPFEGQEFSALNRQLDQLQSALDEIESRNAGIHKELLEILHSNREVRQNIKEEIVNSKEDVVEEKERDSSVSSGSSTNSAGGNSQQSQDPAGLPRNSQRDDMISNASNILSDTSAIAHLLNIVTQDVDKMST